MNAWLRNCFNIELENKLSTTQSMLRSSLVRTAPAPTGGSVGQLSGQGVRHGPNDLTVKTTYPFLLLTYESETRSQQFAVNEPEY